MLQILDCQDRNLYFDEQKEKRIQQEKPKKHTRERSEKHIDGDPNTDFTFSELRKKSRER